MKDKSDLKEFLDEKVEQYDQPRFIETDPIQVPKQFSGKENIENWKLEFELDESVKIQSLWNWSALFRRDSFKWIIQ